MDEVSDPDSMVKLKPMKLKDLVPTNSYGSEERSDILDGMGIPTIGSQKACLRPRFGAKEAPIAGKTKYGIT